MTDNHANEKILHFNFGVSFAFLSEHSSNSMLFDK